MLAQFVYEKGSWEIDTDRRELRAHGRAVPIGSRAFEIIEKLARCAGEFVTKDELVAHVWQGAVVEENTLRVHVHAIRKALGPDRTLLKTAAGRGYRLIGLWTAKRDNSERPNQAVRPSPAESGRPRSNLPAATSQLIGRGPELQQLRALVSAFRVVTLTGAGGIGKTTLALELARSMLSEFDDGVCQVELASLADPQLVPSVVAAALGRSTGATTTASGLARTIGMAKLLLVLDNCEHLADASARLVEAIVRQCPNVSLLVTSREVMRVDGERVFRVPPLIVPEDKSEEQERLLSYSAVELFLTRMQELDDRFLPAETDMSEVAAICRHLDGIPLAIEFAAARAATLGVRLVASGLGNRFDFLTSRRRSALPRQRTLRATLDWSYDLLTDEEQSLLHRLAVFAGGFELEAVAAVVGTQNPYSLVDALDSLVAKSLVSLDEWGTTSRWRLLETIREYAREKLMLSGEFDPVAQRHAEHYRDLLERTEAEWETRSSVELSAEYAWRIDNLRAALDWAFCGNGDASLGIALAAAAVPLWLQFSLFDECRRAAGRALAAMAATGTNDPRREMKLQGGMATSYAHGVGARDDALTAWSRALALAKSIGDVDHQLRSLWGLWLVKPGGVEMARQFCGIATAPRDQMIGQRMMGNALHYRGNHSEARTHIERAIAISSDQFSASSISRFQLDHRPAAQLVLGRILWLQGYLDQARQTTTRAMEVATAVGHPFTLCLVLARAACPIALWAGDIEQARHYVALLNHYMTKHGLNHWRGWARCYQGMLQVRLGSVTKGAELLRAGFDELLMTNQWDKIHMFQGELASASARCGQVHESLMTVEKALDRAELTAEGWIYPELIRIKGELLGLQRASAAEPYFREAIDRARHQGALYWELCGAISLAGSLRDQDRPGEAAAVLRPIFERFLEGLDLPVLRSARALLDALSLAQEQPY